MQFIRVKISENGITYSSQLMDRMQFKELIKKQMFWNDVDEGLTISFSKPKKSALIKGKINQ